MRLRSRERSRTRTFPREASPEEVNVTYHGDGSTSTQRVTGEKVYFTPLAMHTTSVRRPPVTTSQEMVEVEVGKSRKLKRSQLLLVWLECDGTADAQVFHVCRDCSAIRHSKLVLEIQKRSACWGRNEMDTTGERWLMAQDIGETSRIGWVEAGLSAHASDADGRLELTEARRCFWKCDLQKGGALVFVS